MRTTVMLDPDTRLLIDRAMQERSLTFDQAVNELIRNGSGARDASERGFTTPRPLGPPTVDLTRALEISGRLEDREIARRLITGR